MQKQYWVGVDIGSTTAKVAVVDPETYGLVYSRYQRHNAMQAACALELLRDLHSHFSGCELRVAFCGSAGNPFAQATGAFFVQEVVANSLFIRQFHPDVRVAIELGGQDAKVIFFEPDPVTGKPMASEMRMNGSCAGGTGAFIDQVAELLHCKTEDFGGLAENGERTYEVSGRCGVFAKTDIQPLLNQGVSRENIALSTFHAIAKQTIGGLAQGLDIRPPVLFEGGPLTYNPRLVEVFRERLSLEDEQAVVPEHAHVLVAWGAALACEELFGTESCAYDPVMAEEVLANWNPMADAADDRLAQPFFANEDEQNDFLARHSSADDSEYPRSAPGTTLDVVLGVDAGSTTTKFMLLDLKGARVDGFYASNAGDPLVVFRDAILALRDRWQQRGITLRIVGTGTTGYGEGLFAKALHADIHTVETVAHARAARELHPDASFILDIGGQDMKAIFLREGIVSGIVLNEACSSGCGSFIETYSRGLGVPVEKVAEMAFRSQSPSRLGSRCTVFMNSSIITEQRDGKSPEDILAGLCRSVIENVFTKVVRLRNTTELGKTVIVQGGTFRNDAVLRAFEQYSGLEPIRPPRPGEMGAMGIALLTLEHIRKSLASDSSWKTAFPGWQHIETLQWNRMPGETCPWCPNSCNRTVVEFSDGGRHVTGNRCEKGELLGSPDDPAMRAELARISAKMKSVPDLMTRQAKTLVADQFPLKAQSRGITIGIPRVLEFWSSMPFWKTLFQELGFKVVVSKQSDYTLFEDGLQQVPSDTVCFPAKLAHGHINDLIRRKVDRIFFPSLLALPAEHSAFKATAVCPVVQGYPIVIRNGDDPASRGVVFDQPTFQWEDEVVRARQLEDWFHSTFQIPRSATRSAVDKGAQARQQWLNALEEEGQAVLDNLPKDGFAVVLAGRPYHADPLINHHLSSHFLSLGIPVLTLESLPGIHEQDISEISRLELYNSFHCRLLAGAKIAAADSRIEIVQIVSFGCGHDATLSDELVRILREYGGKEPLILKLDEGDVRGPVSIRIKSFIETVKARRARGPIATTSSEPKQLFNTLFTKEDKARRTILVPTLSPGFSMLAAQIFEVQGFKTRPMPLADQRAFELGKKYVHNDICFPAQVNVGEALRLVEKEGCHPGTLALAIAKNCLNCRAGQYSALARKALDEAGLQEMAIVTTGDDTKDMHPGFQANLTFRINVVRGMSLIDRLETMVRAVRPYELEAGASDRVYQHHLEQVTRLVPRDYRAALRSFEEAVEDFNRIPADRSVRKPRVGMLGEILMKYHPAANGFVERYLEANGMEVVQPGMLDFFRRDELIKLERVRKGSHRHPIFKALVAGVSEYVYRGAIAKAEERFTRFRWYDPTPDCWELADEINGLMDRTYLTGEGWMIPAEVLHLSRHGINSFVVIQPFGCLANHISGRGMIKALKKRRPRVQILPLDFDPDTSLANVENRLQMLIINARNLEQPETALESA